MSGSSSTWVTGCLTAGSVFFAGWQVRLVERRQKRERFLDLGAVSLSWQAYDVPTEAGADGYGRTTSRYVFVARNPGRLAIRDVAAVVTFPCPVERVHRDGTSEPASTLLELDTPTIPAGSERVWQRHLRLRYEDHALLRDMTGALTFVHPDHPHHRQRSSWGRGTAGGGTRLPLRATG